MAPENKKISEKLQFFSNFLNFLLILMHIFEKLPQILGLYQIVKIRSTFEKSDPPQTFGGPPSTEKSCINYCLLNVFHEPRE